MLFLKSKESVPSGRPKRRATLRKEKVQELLCVMPAILLLLLISYYPIIELLRISFTDWNLLRKDYQYVGLANWKWLVENLSTNHVVNAFVVTFKYTIGHMVVIIGGGLLLALLFNRMTRGFAFMRSVIFMPKYLAMSSSALMFLWIFNAKYGVANYLIRLMGGEGIGWLSDSRFAVMTIIIVTSWHAIGYDMLIYLSAMQGISKEYYEAAMLDGASSTDLFFRITLPMLAPTTVFLAVTQFIASMKVYQAVDVLTAGGPYRSTEVVVYLIYKLAFEDFRVDRAAVISIVFFLILLVITRLTVKWTDHSVNYDA